MPLCLQVCATSFLGTSRVLQARQQAARRSAAVRVQAADRTLWLPGERFGRSRRTLAAV